MGEGNFSNRERKFRVIGVCIQKWGKVKLGEIVKESGRGKRLMYQLIKPVTNIFLVIEIELDVSFKFNFHLHSFVKSLSTTLDLISTYCQ